MNELLMHTLIVVAPLIVSNTLHMLVVKKGYFTFLEKPLWIWGFGENKTWRGFIILPLLNGFLTWLILSLISTFHTNGFLLGLILGLAYLVFELPNSFLKRRLGIVAGEASQKRKWLFTTIDKLDSSIGVVLVYFLLDMIKFPMAIYLFLIALSAHFLFSYILVLIRIKKSL